MSCSPHCGQRHRVQFPHHSRNILVVAECFLLGDPRSPAALHCPAELSAETIEPSDSSRDGDYGVDISRIIEYP